MNFVDRLLACTAITAISSALAVPSLAQEVAPSGPAADVSAPSDASAESRAIRKTLDEVIVTATRRKTELQDAPVSVSVVTAKDIEDLALQNLDQLSSYVPGLSVSEGGEQTSIAIRGFGSGVNFGFDQSVGMFVDGIYAGRERQFRNNFLDIGSVEVLRGPQAALFGKNTTAGALIITTGQPTQDRWANIYTQYTSEIGLLYTQGIANGGITDNIAARFAFRYSDQEGHLFNTFTGQKEERGEDIAGRLTVLWTPTSSLSIRTKVERSEYERAGRAFNISEVSGLATGRPRIDSLGNPIDTDITARLSTYVAYDPLFEFDSMEKNSKQLETAEVTSNNVALKIDYDFASGFVLTSNTGYSAFDSDDQRDVDWSPVNFLYEPITQDFKQYSQEFQLLSPVGQRFEYMLGAHAFKNEFYVDRRTDVDINVFLLPFGAIPFDPAPFGGPADIWRYSNLKFLDQTTKGVSVFGSGSFHINDTWTLTAGVRYNTEKKTSTDRRFLSEFGTSRFLDPINNPADAAQLAAIQAVLPVDIDRSLLEARVGEELSISENDLSPEVTLTWEPRDSVTLYARATQGHKGGGFNSEVIGPDGARTFDPETVTAFELGGKLRLFGDTANVNFAIFRQDYEDLQSSVWNGITFDVGNAGMARSQGLEADAKWLVGERIELTGAFAWLDARYIEQSFAACSVTQLYFAGTGCGTPADPNLQDLKGKRFAPTISATFGAAYVQPVGSQHEVLFRLDGVHYGRNHSPAGAQDETVVQPAKTLYDFGATLRPLSTDWSFGVLVQNVTDKDGYWFEFEAPGPQIGTRIGLPIAPRRVTVRGSYTF